ncbi:RNA-dependent RNA polymerase [Xinzhou dimarhabdovirus virus 1]|uniref:RNA-dependent RNA polymerase n=1 Tax=Xinzhou dimarhabdovirus virus 1 TaxID=1923768 RepID=UPI00090AF946|nr:RNA-dependent RNA polymerase [Xinzhou dimarhabdovirus virus 1]APG78850.1 RNA-dependent RNA polymerase [Xinzhou dimarhabdovirus virus 1]
MEGYFDEFDDDAVFVTEDEIDWDEYSVAPQSGVELPSFDYNLNSPLLRDEIDALIETLQHRGTDQRFVDKWNFKESIYHLSRLQSSWSRVKGSNGFHRWFVNNIIRKEIYPVNVEELWDAMRHHGELSYQIAITFLKDLTSSCEHGDYNSFLKPDVLSSGVWIKTRSELEWFWWFHMITLIMNSSNGFERQNLKVLLERFNVDVNERGGMNSFRFTVYTSPIGAFHIVPGFIYFQGKHRILDRNMTLMIKDVLGARTTSKLSLSNYKGSDYPKDVVTRLDELYLLGDNILDEADNYAYDILKMVEAQCSLRFMELSRELRPLIPLDNNFRHHVEEAVEEFEDYFGKCASPLFELISSSTNPYEVALFYGSYRHWGHPFLDYFEGLNKLYEQVQMVRPIDVNYANILASDLAYKVLSTEFSKKKTWYVNEDQVPQDHPLRKHIVNNTWPSVQEVVDFGPNWHRLPLIQCYEIPYGIDPAVLYADKSHSMDLSDIISHISNSPYKPIPSKKVLRTALYTPGVNVREFLSEINENGLSKEDLVIGLKGKEREVKRTGRYFSLMSWNLRLYFVITEYLIKKYYVPLFSGLTMADSFNMVMRKLIDRTSGQGEKGYERITFANHFDYSKWNNTQRGKANNPVFRVMGKFLGLPNIISRTHEFFERSWIYYNDRSDLMELVEGEIRNRTTQRVCWNGQLGGLEGLRQKGWSVVSLLVIEREGKIRNTKIKILAQGDNQVVCTSYKLPADMTHQTVTDEIPHIWENNREIVKAIVSGTTKLGLVVNEDETLTASDYLNYGKVILYRGNMLPLITKRWSRVTCVTNDQIPTIGNIMSAVSTNALTVAQFSNVLDESILNYVYFALYCLTYLSLHSPILKGPIARWNNLSKQEQERIYAKAIYLDPSLGGVSGMSLTRFLIRQFPDPVTESLCFWKSLYHLSENSMIKRLCLEAGYPRLSLPTSENFSQLLENPVSLNTPKGLSAQTLLRNAVREQLVTHVDKIENQLFRQSINYLTTETSSLIEFLRNITPLFPRFLSEFRSATFVGLTESLVGLFQNSRTIRQIFKARFSREVAAQMILSEEGSVNSLMSSPRKLGLIWECSSTHADELRSASWGEPVCGTTIPHPYEFMGRITSGFSFCAECDDEPYPSSYISVCYPYGLVYDVSHRGPMAPYLGSVTSESTALFHPWEKEVDVPLLKRSMRLRSAINWFVRSGTNLSNSIIGNLNSLTGLEWDEGEIQFERTGSALHRFHCSRQSAGGFASVNPNLLMYTFVTSDTLGDLNLTNHDFMYQSMLLYCQLVSVERNIYNKTSNYHHFHISCKLCVRELNEVVLNSSYTYIPPDSFHILKEMSGQDFLWKESIHRVQLMDGPWDQLSRREKCFHIGTSQALLYGLMISNHDLGALDQSIFPESVARHMRPTSYMLGIIRGLLIAGCYMGIYHRELYDPKRPHRTIAGSIEYLIDDLINSPFFMTSLCKWDFESLINNMNHRIPPSYPSSKSDLGRSITTFLHHHLSKRTIFTNPYAKWSKRLWIFADFKTPKWVGLSIIAKKLSSLYNTALLSTKDLQGVREMKELIHYFLQTPVSTDVNCTLPPPLLQQLLILSREVVSCKHEIRSAVKNMISETPTVTPPSSAEGFNDLTWGPEFICKSKVLIVNYTSSYNKGHSGKLMPCWNDPLISGLRLAQLATGAHYKLRSILIEIPTFRDVICGGDGSGGMSAAILRMSKYSRLIFNSLMTHETAGFSGVSPGPPAAISHMNKTVRERCVNLMTCWEEPSDLSESGTWKNITKLIDKFEMNIDLIVLDMEVQSDDTYHKIFLHLYNRIHELLSENGSIIIKFYGSKLSDPRFVDHLNFLGTNFLNVQAYYPELSSSFTSEFYIVGTTLLPSSSTRYYIMQDAIEEIQHECFVSHTIKEEFKRALRIKQMNLLQGVPPQLIPDLKEELFLLYKSVGLEAGLSKLMTDTVSSEINSSNVVSYSLSMMTLVSNSIISTTRWITSSLNYPSLEELQKHYSIFLGTWLYTAWVLEDQQLYTLLQWWMRNPVKYGFTIKIWNKTKRMSWQWNRGRIVKCLYKPTRSSIAGQLIRLLSRISTSSTETLKPIDNIFNAVLKNVRNLNKGFTKMTVKQNTGLFYIFDNSFTTEDTDESEIEEEPIINQESGSRITKIEEAYDIKLPVEEGSWNN